MATTLTTPAAESISVTEKERRLAQSIDPDFFV